jgi:glycosyltransferase involved in cell wall biosynthesis
LMVNKIRNYNEVINAEINALRIEDGLQKISFGGSSRLFSIENLVEHGELYLDDIRKSIYEIVIGGKALHRSIHDDVYWHKTSHNWQYIPCVKKKRGIVGRFDTEKDVAKAIIIFKKLEKEHPLLNFHELKGKYTRHVKNK